MVQDMYEGGLLIIRCLSWRLWWQVWNETFAKWLGPLPEALHGPCCAEFIVSRERIEAHPRCGSTV